MFDTVIIKYGAILQVIYVKDSSKANWGITGAIGGDNVLAHACFAYLH